MDVKAAQYKELSIPTSKCHGRHSARNKPLSFPALPHSLSSEAGRTSVTGSSPGSLSYQCKIFVGLTHIALQREDQQISEISSIQRYVLVSAFG